MDATFTYLKVEKKKYFKTFLIYVSYYTLFTVLKSELRVIRPEFQETNKGLTLNDSGYFLCHSLKNS